MLSSIWNYIVGGYYRLCLFGGKVSNEVKKWGKRFAATCLILITLLIAAIFFQNDTLLLIASLLSSIVALVSFYGMSAVEKLFGIVNKDAAAVAKKVFFPICTLSLILSFVSFWASLQGFENITSKQFSVILTVVIFFSIFTVYIGSDNKWTGKVLVVAVVIMLLQFAFPEQYRFLKRATYSTSMSAGAQLDRYSLNKQADAMSTYAYVNTSGFLYKIDGTTSTNERLEVGTKIMVLGIRKDLEETSADTMVPVKLKNADGVFTQQATVYTFPISKLGEFKTVSKIKEEEVSGLATTQAPTWHEVYRQTFTGVGYTGGDLPEDNDGSIETAQAGKDYQIGYRCTVIDTNFEIWREGTWQKFKQGEWITVNTMTPGNYATFRNEPGKKFTVVFQKR